MRKIYPLVLIICLATFTQNAFGQCGSGRYFDKVFTDGFVTNNIDYGGWKKNIESGMYHLVLDLYEPKDDPELLRPLVILVHGGAFLDLPIIDKKSPDIVNMAQDLILRGYVVASPDYRLVSNPFNLLNADFMSKAVVASMLDVNDAICFFVNSYYNGNPYRIDINRLFVGGVSAGAIISLHGLFIDRIDELGPSYQEAARFMERLDTVNIQEVLDNKYCGAKGLGVISVSGALVDTSVIKFRETAVLLSHGTDDNIVPVGMDRPFSIVTLPYMYGPQVIAPKIAATGTRVEYDEWEGSWHVPFLAFDWEEILQGDLREFLIDDFIFDSTMNHIARFCQDLMGCPTGVRDNFSTDLKVYPNPGKGDIIIELPEHLRGSALSLQAFNGLGQLVYSEEVTAGTTKMRVKDLPPGQLFLRIEAVQAGTKTFTAKLLIH